MNNKGQIEGAVMAMVFVLVSIIGLYITLVMWSPLIAVLFPLLDNAETIGMGGAIKIFIMLIPMLLVFSIIIGVLLRIRGQQQGPPVY